MRGVPSKAGGQDGTAAALTAADMSKECDDMLCSRADMSKESADMLC